jgi:BASS family bile acid:Na+ symporter
MITIVPGTAGILVRYFKPLFAKRIERPGRYILPILFLVIYVTAVILSGEKQGGLGKVSSVYLNVLPWALVMNILGMSTGWLSAKWFGYGKDTQITLAVEIGIQNSALAITIASSALFLDNPTMAIPAIVYGLFTFVSALVFGIIIKKSAKIQW